MALGNPRWTPIWMCIPSVFSARDLDRHKMHENVSTFCLALWLSPQMQGACCWQNNECTGDPLEKPGNRGTNGFLSSAKVSFVLTVNHKLVENKKEINKSKSPQITHTPFGIVSWDDYSEGNQGSLPPRFRDKTGILQARPVQIVKDGVSDVIDIPSLIKEEIFNILIHTGCGGNRDKRVAIIDT